MIPGVNQKVPTLTFIMFVFSGLFFIMGGVITYHMMSLDYDLTFTIKNVSPIISAGIVFLYSGLESLYTHRKEKYTRREINKRIALYIGFIFTGFIIAVVGVMVEFWMVCLVGLILALSALASLIETYKIMKCKNDQK